MASITFNDDDLQVLLRVIVAGKFFGSAGDAEVPASPLVASIASRLADAVDASSSEGLNVETLDLLGRWRHIDTTRDEWRAALDYATSHLAKYWDGWDTAKRRSVIGDLLAPFFVTPENLRLFELSVTSLIADRNTPR